jgi:hypothetical protein
MNLFLVINAYGKNNLVDYFRVLMRLVLLMGMVCLVFAEM